MAKTLLISVALIIIIVLLLIIVAKPPTTIVTTPAPEEVQITEEPTPRVEEPERGEPTEKAEEPRVPPSGVPLEKVYPQEVTFWVNEIRVPETTTEYYYGAGFIPIKENKLKTFSGSFGPYFEDPTQHIRVILCSEFYRVQAAPACEVVPTIYKSRYVSFARGYQFDEYIGGMAAKDYLAYYTVYAGDTSIAVSNKAVIRTVRD